MDGITYEQVLAFSQSWGSVYFLVMFAVVCVYALWPSNKQTFKEAANIPLEDDEVSP
ncbi:MAG TPA: cbb3-type cytochrome c oxidase subunit 3 [Rhizomicrobium sp.]|nr:cbb3-type cytochrome c oxidase subunit 3 [Rhizomicrobium sp.]